MSITVADVMKLPSMRGAKVLGGAGGLTRVVSRSPYWNMPVSYTHLIIALLLAIMMLCGITAFAEEAAVDEADRNYAPESGTGWMSVDIHGEHEELTYVESCLLYTSGNFPPGK